MNLTPSRELTPVSPGDVVHLEGRTDGGSWLVDREQGFLVLFPDTLVSGTSVSSSIRCMRRAVLGDMFKVDVVFFIGSLHVYSPKCPVILKWTVRLCTRFKYLLLLRCRVLTVDPSRC